MKEFLLAVFSASSIAMAAPSGGDFYPIDTSLCGWHIELGYDNTIVAEAKYSSVRPCADYVVMEAKCIGNKCYVNSGQGRGTIFTFLPDGNVLCKSDTGILYKNYRNAR